MVVLDSNVVSELMRPAPDLHVLRWIEAQPRQQLDTTSITVAEIHYGIRRLPEGRRREQLAAAAADIFGGFAWQVLSFDQNAAYEYAELVAERDRTGQPINAFDAQIAGICRATCSTLATRNTSDFAATGVELINPWQP